MKLQLAYMRAALRKYRRSFLLCLLFILLITAFQSLIPLTVRYFLDCVTARDEPYFLIALGVGFYALIYLLISWLKVKWYQALNDFGGFFISDLMTDLQTSLSLAPFEKVESLGTDKLKHMLYHDVLEIFRVVAHHSSALISTVLLTVTAFALAFAYELKVALLLALAFAGGLALSFITRKWIVASSQAMNVVFKQHHETVSSFVDALPLIQTNRVGGYFHRQGQQSIDQFITRSKQVDGRTTFITSSISAFHLVFSILMAALMTVLFRGENSALLNFVFYTLLANLIMSNASNLEAYVHQILMTQASFANIEQIKNLPRRRGTLALPEVVSIELKELSYRYGNCASPVWQDLNYRFQKGDAIQIIGANGSGKSTLLKLLTGLYTASSGAVLLNGRALQDYAPQDVQQQMVYLNQEEVFLNETVGEYLQLITQTPSLEKVTEGIAELGLEGLPDFAKTISAGGKNLSAGERKKLLLLKLWQRYDRASVFIIDEVDSGLDKEGKAKLYEHINALLAQKAKIFIFVSHLSQQELNCNLTIHLESGSFGDLRSEQR